MRVEAYHFTGHLTVWSKAYPDLRQRNPQNYSFVLGMQWIPHTKGQQCRKCVHVLKPSWHTKRAAFSVGFLR